MYRLASPEPSKTPDANQTGNASNLTICSVVVSELIFGAERALPAHQANNRIKVDQLRQQFISLPFDDAAAEASGVVRAHLASLGTPIGPNELLIASIALANQLILVTHNTSEFSRVPGLLIEDWH